jgi:hypothetical protein
MSAADEIVGHKTFSDGNGGFRHEPLRRSEADDLMRRAEAEDARRKELMPDEDAARKMFFDAWLRLKDFGWREAMYCPKDGRMFEVIEAGSTGVFRCEYTGEWPTGSYWIHSENDLWPSRPTMYRELPPNA